MVGLGDLIMPLIIHDLLIVNLISIAEGSQPNNFQWDIKRIEAKSNVILKSPSMRTATLS